MKKILVLCIMFGGLLIYAEDQPIMIEKLSDSHNSLGYPRVEPITEMSLRSQINTRELAERIETFKRQNTVLENRREASTSTMLSHSPRQPDFSPFTLNEFLVDTSRYPVGVPGQQRYPRIAFDGINFMAVWMDYTRGVVGARIAQDGTILDKPAFLISQSASVDLPDIVFDSTNYFVTWCVDNGIYGARIRPDGNVLDPNGFIIADNAQYSPAVDYGNGVYLVVWQLGSANADVWGSIVDTNGTVESVFPILDDPYEGAWHPDVSFNGTNFIVVFYGNTPSYQWGKRIAPDGTILDQYPFQICNQDGAMMADVDFDGTNWFVVWSWLLNDFSCAWVTPDGDSFGEINNIPGSGGMWIPELAVGDSIHWLQGIDAAGSNPPVDIYITRIDFQGNVLDNPWIPVDTSPGWQAYGGNAYGDSTFIAIWEDQVNWDIYARHYAADGSPIDSTRFVVNIGGSQLQCEPAVAFDGTDYLTVYHDDRQGGYGGYGLDIYGSRITQDGTLLDPEGFLVHQGICNFPAVTFGDSLYLCVWQTPSGYDLWGTRLLPNGTVLDPDGFQITFAASADYHVSASYNNGIFLVAYNRGSPYWDIKATRVTPDGQVLDSSGILIRDNSPGVPYWPEVAPYGNGFLVTWQWNSYDDYIEGARVSFQGTVLDSPAVQISLPGVGGQWHGLASSGDTFFVVWDQGSSEIHGARVDSSCNILDPTGIPICINQANSRTQPSVAFNGKDFVVAWQDARLESSQYDLFGARVSPTGIVLDTNGIEFVNSEYSRVNVELASATPEPDTGAQVLLVFEGFVGEPYNANRALGAIYYPPTGIKEDYVQTIPAGYKITISPNISRQQPYALNYSVSRQTEIDVNVYDITGRMLKNVYNGNIKGTGEIKFNLAGMPQGIYFVRVESDNKTGTTKVLWLR